MSHCKPLFDFVMFDSVTPETINWLWPKRFALSKINIIEGNPGEGKSTLAIDLAARVSKGLPMPDGSAGIQGGVVFLSSEDGIEDTIAPRLEAAGADMARIAGLRSIPDANGNPRVVTIEDIEAIEQMCEKVSARLLIIDTLAAHTGRANLNNDQAMRRVLLPLSRLAEKIGMAVLIVRHLNKSGSKRSMYRGSGTIGVTGIARCVYLVAKLPDDEKSRVLVKIKNNAAPEDQPSLRFTIAEAGESTRLEWIGESHHNADTLSTNCPEEEDSLEEALTYLSDQLSEGPMEVKRIYSEGRKVGIKRADILRAKLALGAKLLKNENGAWVWALNPRNAKKNSD